MPYAHRNLRRMPLPPASDTPKRKRRPEGRLFPVLQTPDQVLLRSDIKPRQIAQHMTSSTTVNGRPVEITIDCSD